MADRDLTVSATIEGNASGAQPVVDGLKKINDAGGQAGGALKNLDGAAKASGEALGNDLAGKTMRTREIIQGLSMTLQGGTSSFLGLGRVVQSVMATIQGVSTASLGIIGLVIGGIVLAVQGLIDMWNKMGEEATKNFDIIKSNAKEIENTESVWDGQIEKLNQMEAEYKDAAAASDALRNAQEKHLDAKLNMQLKQLDLEEQRALAKAGGDKVAESAIKSEFSEKRFMATTAREDEKAQAKISAYNDSLERNSEQLMDVNQELGRHKRVLELNNSMFEQLAMAVGLSVGEARALLKDKAAYSEALKKATEAEKKGESTGQDASMLASLGQYGANVMGAEKGISKAERQKAKLLSDQELTTIARDTEMVNIQSSKIERQRQAFDQGKETKVSIDQLAAEMRRLTEAIAGNKQDEFDATTSSGSVESLNDARNARMANEKSLAEVTARYNSLQSVSKESTGMFGQDYVAGTKAPQAAQAAEAVQQATSDVGTEMATSVRGMGQTISMSMGQVAQEVSQSTGSFLSAIEAQNRSIQALVMAVQKTDEKASLALQQNANMR